MEAFARGCKLKVAINHQLHFHPRRRQLQELVQDGAIGALRFIDASARMNMAYQGTHVLQSVAAIHPQGRPSAIFGPGLRRRGLAGKAGASTTRPTRRWRRCRYEDGASALLRCGTNGAYVLAGDERVNVHKQLTVYGAAGLRPLSMWGLGDAHRRPA